MRRQSTAVCMSVALLVLGVLASPLSVADDSSKTELSYPDEVYFDLEGPTFGEDKQSERESGSSGTTSVTVDMLEKDAEETTRTTVTFPYEKFDWTVGSWYKSSLGLRFYDVSYGDEKLLCDYRVPWVKVGTTKYNLTSQSCIDGPDLSVYTSSEAFKVWAKYRIAALNIDVQVYCYFFGDGEMDPWAVVDCHGTNRNLVVPQRFDFDLGGSDDDNAQHYASHPTGDRWDLVTVEGGYADANQPEDGGIQWALFDSDRQGLTYVLDQCVDVQPYHADSPVLTVLRYHGSQVDGYPGDYDNDETTGVLISEAADPYNGYDLVVWYVSSYTREDYCNPGPWLYMDV